MAKVEMSETIPVLGQIKSVVRKGFEVISYNVFSPETNKTVTFVNEGFLPIEVGDLFFARATINPEGEYVAKYPFCQIGDDDETIRKCFFSCFYGRQDFRKVAWEYVRRAAGSSSPQDIDNFLQEEAEIRNEASDELPPWSSIEGLSPEINSSLLNHWFKKRNMRQLYLLNLTTTEIRSYYQRPRKMFRKLINNPYSVPVISIEKCEEILERLDRKEEITSEQKYLGRLNRYVYKMSKNGFVFIEESRITQMFPEWKTYSKTVNLRDYDLVLNDEKFYMLRLFNVQNRAIEIIERILNRPDPLILVHEKRNLTITLTAEQQTAIEGALSKSLSIITGGGGTGKTTIIKEIVKTLKENKLLYLVTSFTGKAVCRLREVLESSEPKTMHRFLHEFRTTPEEERPKPVVIIIDEISMVSTQLFADFMSLYPGVQKVILVGDVNQLPPIECGYLTAQLLASQTVPVFTLTFVHRLCDGSVSNSILVNSQALATANFSRWIEGDQFILDPQGNLEDFITAFKAQGVSASQLRIIMPFKNSKIELVHEINAMVQRIYFPTNRKMPDFKKERWWKIKDQVMITENSPSVGLFNGQEGEVAAVFPKEKQIQVTFNVGNVPTEVIFDVKEKSRKNERDLDKKLTTAILDLAYCLTVHKSQGSEWDFVIMFCPFDVSNTEFVDRKLIYTAITRAKRMCVLSGNINLLTNGAKNGKLKGQDDLAGLLRRKLPTLTPIQDLDEEIDCYDDYDF